MAKDRFIPEADRLEQEMPSTPDSSPPFEGLPEAVEVPEADRIEQVMPVEPGTAPTPSTISQPGRLVSEADLLEQLTSAYREPEDDE